MASGYKKGMVKNGRGLANKGLVQNVKAAKVYVFGNDNVIEDDEQVEFELPEIRSRGKGSGSNLNSFKDDDQQPLYFEKLLQEGDTLQNISLKYACSVSELKRINNLIQDQEFHALKVLKVPMNKYGILSEQLSRGELSDAQANIARSEVEEELRTSFTLSDESIESDSQHDFSDPETQVKVIRTLNIRENSSPQGQEAEKFLRKLDADLKKLRPASYSESLDEVISVCSDRSFYPPQPPPKPSNGADCGISYKTIIAISLLIATLPLVYFGYYYFYEEKHS